MAGSAVARWPTGFAACMALMRETFRQVPPSLLGSGPAVRMLQPATQFFRWPTTMLPRGVRVRPAELGGLQGEWLLPHGASVPTQASCERILLWAHGGGFVFCSPGTHRLFLAKVAARVNMPVFCVDYRKPPEHPFPVPGNDVLRAYRELRAQGLAEKVFIGGDSAGGNLVLSVVSNLARPQLQHVPRPDGVVLLSPWVDLSDTSAVSFSRFAGTDYIPARQAEAVADVYAGGMPLKDERISPGLRKQWPLCPPVLLDYGGCEVFRSQIEQLAKSMREAGVNIDALAGEDMVHGYPLLEFLWGWGPGPFEGYFQRLETFLSR